MNLHELFLFLSAELVSTSAPEEIEITRAVPFAEAEAGSVTLLDDVKKLSSLAECAASAVILPAKAKEKLEGDGMAKWNPQGTALLFAENPRAAFTKIVAFFNPPIARPKPGIHPRAVVDESVKIGPNVTIMANAVIGPNVELGANVIVHPNVCLMEGVRVGDDSIIFPNVTVYEKCIIGARCILHAGCVIGVYGFGYDSSSGEHVLEPQLGNVELADDVEIGANATIDRGTFGSTRIGQGTKVDNMVQIGHNCQIGRANLFCSQVGIAGSTTTGDYVVLAGQVGVTDHVHLADGVIVGAQAGVPGNLTEKGTYLGSPCANIHEAKRQFVSMKQLPDYWKTLKKLAQAAEN
ncbi:MAG: UDP-3-O-(3-hydroxymyristoyl)glucosamine N-acyltransferase [Thermoguttaceae bacterium]|nr:UDP-3-O-(3-hydroxymyristoyl)glucosamine N-acyltransferase [Thermoguttaceae bacterium]MBR0191124.1 UDP-3-O-(3-hydroxymyristoyl)glucosamine N-acyltransferase [Thermoguttaceae bacterium]